MKVLHVHLSLLQLRFMLELPYCWVTTIKAVHVKPCPRTEAFSLMKTKAFSLMKTKAFSLMRTEAFSLMRTEAFTLIGLKHSP